VLLARDLGADRPPGLQPNRAVRLAERLETKAQEALEELRARIVTTAESSRLFLPVEVRLPG
jgi:hypothetical protein